MYQWIWLYLPKYSTENRSELSQLELCSLEAIEQNGIREGQQFALR